MISDAVGRCTVLIALIGPGWAELLHRSHDGSADQVVQEIGGALRKRTRVVPVLVDGAVLPRAADLPEALQRLPRHQAVRLGHATFDADAPRLLAAVAPPLEPPTAPRSARWEQIAGDDAAGPPGEQELPPPPPLLPRSDEDTDTLDLTEFQVRLWAAGAVPVLLEVRSGSDPAPIELDIVLRMMAAEYRGRLLVGRLTAEVSPGFVVEQQITTFPTLLLYREGREVRRAVDPDTRSALLRGLPELLS